MAIVAASVACHLERSMALFPAINKERATDASGLFDKVELQKQTGNPLVGSIKVHLHLEKPNNT